MATFGTYTINGPDLLSSTVVFGPSPATTVAPDGLYSDGTTVRQQISGVLQAVEACPACSSECDIPVEATNGNVGLYKMTVDVGTATTGAIRVRFLVYAVPDGILVEYNGNFYNKLSSEVLGYMNTGIAANLPIYVGKTSDLCETSPGSGVPMVPCVGPCTPLAALPIYNYNSPSWVDSGTTGAVTILATQDGITATAPETMVMIIPKNSVTSSMDITIYGICDDTAWQLIVECPGVLPSTATTGFDAASFANACADATALTVYRGKVNGTDALPDYFDWVYTDNQGVTPATAGFYKYVDGVNKWFEVSSDGVIVGMGTC